MNESGSLSDYILKVMKESGLSYADIVEKAGKKGFKITHSYLSKIVSGAARNVSVDKLRALAAGLDRPEQEVFAIASGKALQKDDIEDATIKAIAFGYPQLTEKDKREIAILLKTLEREIKERLEK